MTPFTIRPMRPEDAPACLEIATACEAADGPKIFIAADELVSKMRHPHFGHDSSFVAEQGGRVAGYFMAMRCRPDADQGIGRAYVRLLVRPECRRRGVGAALWNAGLERVHARDIRRVDTTVYATSEAGLSFALEHGLQRAARFWKMRLVPAEHRPGRNPHAAVVRTYRQDDADAELLTAMYNAAFATHFGHVPATAAETRALEVRQSFDRELLLVAEQDGRGVGFSRCEVDAKQEGWVEVLGVVPEAQGAGLGRHLLDRSVELLTRRGANAVVLIVVGDNENALRLYETAGFKVELEFQIFRGERPA